MARQKHADCDDKPSPIPDLVFTPSDANCGVVAESLSWLYATAKDQIEQRPRYDHDSNDPDLHQLTGLNSAKSRSIKKRSCLAKPSWPDDSLRFAPCPL